MLCQNSVHTVCVSVSVCVSLCKVGGDCLGGLVAGWRGGVGCPSVRLAACGAAAGLAGTSKARDLLAAPTHAALRRVSTVCARYGRRRRRRPDAAPTDG